MVMLGMAAQPTELKEPLEFYFTVDSITSENPKKTLQGEK